MAAVAEDGGAEAAEAAGAVVAVAGQLSKSGKSGESWPPLVLCPTVNYGTIA